MDINLIFFGFLKSFCGYFIIVNIKRSMVEEKLEDRDSSFNLLLL